MVHHVPTDLGVQERHADAEPHAALALRLRNAIADAALRSRLSDHKTSDVGTVRKPPKKVELTADIAMQIVAALEAASPADAQPKAPEDQ